MNPGYSPVYAYLRNPTMVDFDGHLAAVFFLSGCNFRCPYCHNPGLMTRQPQSMEWNKLEAACRQFAENWVDGAVITGGEPLLSPALPELMQFFHSRGWAVKLDTNGSNPTFLADCLPLADAVAMDIKAGLSGYETLTGFKVTEAIVESIEQIKTRAPTHEFRTTIIESYHDDRQVLEMADMIRGAKRYVLQPFVPKEDLPGGPEYRNMPRTSAGRLHAIRDMVADCADEVLVRGD